MYSLEDKLKQRLQFLLELYKLTDGNTTSMVSMWDIGKTLGFDRDTTIKVVQYLQGEGLLDYKALGGIIGITHRGVMEVEESMKNKEKPTEHFPPLINIISAQNIIMTHSTVQQGHSLTQYTTIDETNKKNLNDIVKELKELVGKSKIDSEKEAELAADTKTIETQLLSPKPKTRIIVDALASVKNVVQGVAAAVPIVQMIDKWLEVVR